MRTNTDIPRHLRLIMSRVGEFSPSLRHFSHQWIQYIYPDLSSIPPHFFYLCPLCLQNYILIEKKKFVWTQEFTLDHVPPKSVGGKQKVSTCKSCNDVAGSDFESALKNTLKWISFSKRTASSGLKVFTEITNVPGRYGSTLYYNNQGILEVNPKPQPNYEAPHLDQWINQSPTIPWEAKVTVPRPDDSAAGKALVKAAYLASFAYWGYDFVFSDGAQMMRSYLRGEIEYPMRTPLIWLGDSIKNSIVSRFPTGPCYLQKPESCKTLAVNFELKDLQTGFRELAVVPIPAPIEDPSTQLRKIQDSFDAICKTGNDIAMGHVMGFSIREGKMEGYRNSWNFLCTDLL